MNISASISSFEIIFYSLSLSHSWKLVLLLKITIFEKTAKDFSVNFLQKQKLISPNLAMVSALKVSSFFIFFQRIKYIEYNND